MDKKRFIELATKYLSNEATFEEKEELSKILKDEKYKEMFVWLSENWEDLGSKKNESNFNLDRGLQKLTKKIRIYEPEFDWDDKRETAFNRRNSFLKVAAIVLIFISLSIFTLHQFNFNEERSAPVTLISKKTLPGQKSIVTLFDGTKVILNAGSELKYPQMFGNKTREVYLKGEAYFEVIHDSRKPFIVHSGELATTVLGTKFNVMAFPDESIIKISLVNGKVVVSKTTGTGNAERITLQPKQQYVYDVKSKKGTIKKFDVLQEVGWKDNKYVFDNVPLSKALIRLGRAFGVKFELGISDRNKYRIKANFNNESLWTILEAIRYATNLNYKITYENRKMKKITFGNKRTVRNR